MTGSPRLSNPWLALPKQPPYWLPEDRPHLEAFNRTVSPRYQLADDLFPEPFLGPRDAPLVVLMLNPGRVAADTRLHRSAFKHKLRANLGDDPQHHDHLGLDPEFAAKRSWWTDRFAPVINAGHEPSELAGKVLSVEFHGYHAQSFRAIPFTLPSQRYGFQVLEDAIDRGATIVVFRGIDLWEVAVPRLRGYERLVRKQSRRSRSAYVSPGNLGRRGFTQVLGALE